MNYYESVNFPFDAVGEDDPRPGCWGTAAYCDVLVPILNVPANKRVKLISFHGDCYAYINGTGPGNPPLRQAPAGSNAGICCGFITKTSGPIENDPLIISGIKYIGGFNDASPLAKADLSPLSDPRAGAYSDCNVYLCDAVSASKTQTRIPINRTDLQGTLDEHNCLLMRQAFFLNDTGLPIHLEITGVLEWCLVNA